MATSEPLTELPTTEQPITRVHIDGLAVLKIVKHCQESLPQLVTGSLLGLTVDNGVLEITHAFPFPEPRDPDTKSDVIKSPAPPDDQDDDAAIDGHEFQLEMMKMLREVNVDNNCVGWYQSMYLGSYSTHSLVENQLSYQTDLSPNAVVLLYDPIQTAHGNLVLKCFRLTDQAVHLKANNKNHFLDPKQIFHELPVTFTNTHLAHAFLFDLKNDPNYHKTLSTKYDTLDLSTQPYLEKHLEFLCTWVDDLVTEQLKFQLYTRNLNRHNKGFDKRKGKHHGEDAAGEEAWAAPDAPRRIESLLINNQIRSYCDQLDKFAGAGFSKLFLAAGFHENE